MSTASSTLRLILIGEDKSASKSVKGVGDEAEKSSKKMGTFHKVGTAAGVALAGGLTLAAGAAIKMTKNAADDAQSAARLAASLKQNTGATKTQTDAVEGWITAQGKATGFTDEELRPALSRLAIATGSVGKSQKLAALAMDISTRSGKPLKTVAEALAKAQAGNVASLAKLGVRTTETTKDTGALEKAQTGVKQATLSYNAALKAHGKNSVEASIAADKLKQAHEAVGAAQEKTKRTTLSLDQITQNLTKQYGGAAAKNADTAAGKAKILNVQYEELQEQIGANLLPVMSKLMTIGLAVVNWITNNTKVAGILVGVLGGLAAVVYTVSLATKLWATWTKIQTAGQWLLNAAMDANPIGLVVIALAALVAGLVIAYKKSETFRNIVNGAFHGIAKVVGAVVGFIRSHWKLLFVILTGPIGLAVLLITKHWGKIKAGVSNAFGFIKSVFSKVFAVLTAPFLLAVTVISNVWGRIKSGVSNAVSFVKDKFGDVVSFVKGIPDKLASIAGDFLSAGKNLGGKIISGLLDGLKAVGGMVGNLAGAIKGAINSALHLPFTIHGPGPLPDFTIPAFAKGVANFSGGLALVGERGPELVGLPRGSSVYPHGRGPGMGGTTVNINVNVPRGADKSAAGREIVQALEAYGRLSGVRVLSS